MPRGEPAALPAAGALAGVSSFFAIWTSLSCLFSHVITAERKAKLLLFEMVSSPSSLKEEAHCYLSSLVPFKGSSWSFQLQASEHPRHPTAPREGFPPCSSGCCTPITARGSFSTHDNNGSSSQKPQKLLLSISVLVRSLGHFYRGRKSNCINLPFSLVFSNCLLSSSFCIVLSSCSCSLQTCNSHNNCKTISSVLLLALY